MHNAFAGPENKLFFSSSNRHTLQGKKKKKDEILELSFSVDAKQRRRDANWARRRKECFLFGLPLGGAPIIKTNRRLI